MDFLSIPLSCVMCNTDCVHILSEGETIESFELTEVGFCPKCINLCLVCAGNEFDLQNGLKLCIDCYNRHLADKEMDLQCEIIEGVTLSIIEFEVDMAINRYVERQDLSDVGHLAEEESELLSEIMEEIVLSVIGVELDAGIDDYIANSQVADALSVDKVGGISSHIVDVDEDELDNHYEVIDEDEYGNQYDQGNRYDNVENSHASVHNNNDLRGDLCQAILSTFTKCNSGMGSDGYGGSTNGELTNSSCKKIVDALNLKSGDKLLDIGSGSGLTVARLCAMSACNLAIGIEVEHQRHDIAVNFNNALMNNFPDQDFPIAFMNADVKDLSNFEGLTKIFIYDAVFTVDLMIAIGERVNKSSTIQLIASTHKDLRNYGFDVEETLCLDDDYTLRHIHESKVGCLAARGGKMSHTFYITKPKKHAVQLSLVNVIDRRIVEYSNIALLKQLRLEHCLQHIHAINTSTKFPRSQQLRDIIGDPVIEPFGESAMRLYDILSGKNPSVGDTLFHLEKSTTAYNMYNIKSLQGAGRIEAGALYHKSSKKALLAPSSDGTQFGKVLAGLVYDDKGSNCKYFAIIYDVMSKEFTQVAAKDIWNKFSHELSIPNVSEIQKAYRLKYPLHLPETETPQTNPRARTPSSRVTPVLPPVLLKSRKASSVRVDDDNDDDDSKGSFSRKRSLKIAQPPTKKMKTKSVMEILQERLNKAEVLLKQQRADLISKDAELKKEKERILKSKSPSSPVETPMLTSSNCGIASFALAPITAVNMSNEIAATSVPAQIENAVNRTKIDHLTAQLAASNETIKANRIREDAKEAADEVKLDKRLDREDKINDLASKERMAMSQMFMTVMASVIPLVKKSE